MTIPEYLMAVPLLVYAMTSAYLWKGDNLTTGSFSRFVIGISLTLVLGVYYLYTGMFGQGGAGWLLSFTIFTHAFMLSIVNIIALMVKHELFPRLPNYNNLNSTPHPLCDIPHKERPQRIKDV